MDKENLRLEIINACQELKSAGCHDAVKAIKTIAINAGNSLSSLMVVADYANYQLKKLKNKSL